MPFSLSQKTLPQKTLVSVDRNLDIDTLVTDNELTPEELALSKEPFTFETHFQGMMGMLSDSKTVAQYLDAHEGWFSRCAQPMTAEPLGNNGYILTIGHFGAFGYEVEPKMAVVLAPPDNGLYLMYSIDVPEYQPPGYEVNYKASMTLEELEAKEVSWPAERSISQLVTEVKWQLHLCVTIEFPGFIYKLPKNLLQKTGDQLLTQIVKQISPRLTYKVQKDFHDTQGLPLPPKVSRRLTLISPSQASKEA